MKFLFLTAIVIVIWSCNPSISRYGYNSYSNDRAESKKIPIIKNPSLNVNIDDIVGEVEIGDTGFSTNCGAEEVSRILISEALKVNANLINILEIKPPDLWSTCYRIKAALIKLDESSTMYSSNVQNNSYEIGSVEKYIDGVHIDSLSMPKPDLKVGLGYEILSPQMAFNANIYYKTFLFRYAYGFSASTNDPQKMIKDIDHSHHFKFSYCFGYLGNVVSY